MPALRRLIVLFAGFGALAPSFAHADRASIYRDCQDGRINGSYSQKQYRDALENIPTDVDEYTDCRDVIRRAQLAAAGGSRGSGSGGSGSGAAGGSGSAGSPGAGAPATAGRTDPLAAASPTERAAVERTRSAPGAPVQIGGEKITPAPLGYEDQSSLSEVPTPLLVVLILLAASALAAAGVWLRSRVIARRAA